MAGGSLMALHVATALILVAVAIAVSFRRKLGLERDLAIATIRALVQLTALAAILGAVFAHFWLAAIVLPVMLGAATFTSTRRLTGVPNAPKVALISIATASVLALAILFGLGAFRFIPDFFIPIAGMLIGNCMTATSLAGARVRDEITDKVLEVEARLALGVPARESLRPYTRRAAANALIPTIDATKNVGIVVLPGAFVGAALGGASAARAAEVQLIVLFMLLGAVSVAAMISTGLVAREFVGPGERIVLPVAPSRS